MRNAFLSNLYEFAKRTEISYQEMKRVILEAGRGGLPVTIYSTKLDGSNRVFDDSITVNGPGGKAMGGTIYWRAPYYYMIVREAGVGFRTVVLRNVSKLKVGGKTLYVK
jgi:hypothetical protein